MDLELTGKTAIITGGSRGIGKAIALELAREGVDVAIAARDTVALETTAEELRAETGRKIVVVQVNTSSDASVKAMVERAVAELGGVDILVNNAAKAGGQGAVPKLSDITDDIFWDDVNVKVMGYLRCAREVAPHMVERNWGRIINISGLAARQTGSIVGSVRNVSVSALTKNLAEELAPHNITVSVVHPGLTRTEATEGVVARMAEQRGVSPDEAEAMLVSNTLANRMIEASDIAAVVAFLASPRSIAINGDAIAAGGGVARAIHY
jgi:NAD(P)-dependent dehydrogenase (short-subunit alcohol dehydrogenase family)